MKKPEVKNLLPNVHISYTNTCSTIVQAQTPIRRTCTYERRCTEASEENTQRQETEVVQKQAQANRKKLPRQKEKMSSYKV
jgi:hypothetical protein